LEVVGCVDVRTAMKSVIHVITVPYEAWNELTLDNNTYKHDKHNRNCCFVQKIIVHFYLHLQDVGNRVTLWTIMSPLHFYLHLQDVGNRVTLMTHLSPKMKYIEFL
jgi:hypothetical protein